MAKRPTIRDIADEAGVGVGTVSRVLNRHPNVSASTRRTVMDVIERLGYLPRTAAREIRGHRSNLLGLLSHAVVTTPFAHDLLRGAQEEARAHGRMLLLIETEGRAGEAERAVGSLYERGVEGVLYATLVHHDVDPPASLRQLPMALVNARDVRGELPSVVPDEELGGYEATRHLLEHGHRRIAMITNDAFEHGDPATLGRHAGYRRALEEAGVRYDPALVREGEGRAPSGRRATAELLRLPSPPTALFCGTDRTAMGAYEALRHLGLGVPSDVSIVGFDDQRDVADALDPGLTTMALPHAAMGRWGVARVLERSDGRPLDPVQVRLRCPLVPRASVAPVRSDGGSRPGARASHAADTA
jgi:LacI family transcriptional regulator